ncbi:MAG: nucleotide disphospho-sugar-binding domain-containing protein [Mycobacteriales bacterium]
MRALFVAGPGVGHVFPMVPLAWALRARGQDVLMATAGPGLVVANAGLSVIDLRPGWDYRAAIAARWGSREARPPGRPRGGSAEGAAVEVFGQPACSVAVTWRPDVVIGRSLAAFVAATLQLPFVDHGVGLMRTAGAGEDEEVRRPVFTGPGVGDPPPRRLTINLAPPSMTGSSPTARPMRYVPYNGGGVLSPELLEFAPRPRVAVTLGTAVPLTDGLDSLAYLFRAVTDLSAEFVVALGDVGTDDLPPPPDNVRLAGWVPLNALLRSCSLLIHHGGDGTAMTALALGVPQLVLANGVCQYVADAVEARGVGHGCTIDRLQDS